MHSIVSVLYDATPSAYMVHSDTMAYIGLIMANICLNYGNSIFAPFAYIMVALLEQGILKRFQIAYDYTIMGFKLNEKFPNMETRGRSYFATGNMMHHWVKPVEEHLPLVLSGLRIFQEVGNIPWANYSKVFNRSQSIFFNKNTLADIEEENNFSYKLHIKSKDREVILNQYMIMRFIKLQLADTVVLPENFYGFKEDEYEKEMGTPGNNVPRCYYFVFKNIELYNKKDFIGALKFGWRGFKILHEIFGILLDFMARFYFNLTYLASYSQLSRLEKAKYGLAYKINKFLIALSAKKNPSNFLAHNYILLAEENRIEQNHKFASEYYELANKEAQKAGFCHNIGLVNEIAANYYYSINQNSSAEIFILNARHAYFKWGATNKVKDIDARYPGILNTILSKLDIEADIEQEENSTKNTTYIPSQGTRYSTTKVMDFGSIFKASQTLSGEIVLEKLLEKLMKLLLESAGATNGYLLFTDENQLYIEASGNVSSSDIIVMQSIPLRTFTEISVNIVNYVFRTKQNVILGDALKEGNFTNDPYIRKKEMRSVLCAPILNQGKLVGIIYLENNLTTGAFTKERIEVLQVLASQAAISIDNAHLYDNLEQKVKERTKKLNEALDEVNLLKEKQDGDYYLTSLLINPLGKNFAISENVKIEFFVKQKKQFHYRKWDSEIGGDINTAYNIKLKGKDFIVFANADAMGKSMQGAGGALVFGSVFKSIIERTNSNPLLSNVFPEQWVKSLFVELHKVFISFDGSMLMSLVLGLIDESTGLLYYINVEHPEPVLYRNGKAAFLPNRRTYYKLGTQIDTGGFVLETYSLCKGDIIILGSDGRDDFILGKNPLNGDSIVNENENEFLNSVERGEGNLGRIFEDILSKGEQMDDLSLLKIEYVKESDEREEQTSIEQSIQYAKIVLTENNMAESIQILNKSLETFPESESLLKEIIQILVNEKKYKEAIEYLERYIDIYPMSIQYIHYTSFCYRKTGRYKNSIEMGERILLREPDHLKNLQNLSKCYAGLKDEKNFLRIQARIDALS
jgi:serine phosphatase RsbU (regulator of sigma subunit)